MGEAEGGEGEVTGGMKVVELHWNVRKTWEKEVEQLGKAGEGRRTTGRGGPPVALSKKLQLPPIKANLPGPLSGFQMTIPAVC